MARPLSYPPPGAQAELSAASADELDAALRDLLAALHRGGGLRLLSALAERGGEALEPLLTRLDSPAGEQALTNLALLARLLGTLEPAAVERSLQALAAAVATTTAVAPAVGPAAEAPSLPTLLRRLGDPAVRRGLDAALTLLAAFGGALAAPPAPERER